MKLLLKITLRIAGLLITLAVLSASFTVITERASSEYSENGAYSSELVTWEQEHAGEGTLMVCGKPVRLDFEQLDSFRNGLSGSVARAVSVLPEEFRTAVSGVWTAVSSSAETVIKLIFSRP